MSNIQIFSTGDTIRMHHYPICDGFRCWKIIGVHLGKVKQESTYELLPLDVFENKTIQVPYLILETHPGIVKI